MPLTLDARRLVVDYRNGLISVERRDRSIEVQPLGSRPPIGAIRILRSEYDVDARELHLTLPEGDRLTVEIGLAGGKADCRPDQRPAVYLDQNHWIALARYRYSPDKQSDETNAAAGRMIELAQRKAVILPLSAAHVVETTRSDGRFRHDLATTMLSLSRGWQMRSPLRVRAYELSAGMTGDDASAPEVVTLDPDHLFATDSTDWEPAQDLPAFARDLLRRITAIAALFDVIIEDEKEDSVRGRELAARWARIHDDLAQHLRDDKVSKTEIREIALGLLFADLQDDIAHAALVSRLSPEDFGAWMEHDADEAIARMPHLGRLRELILKRLRNADERWLPNDLHDAIYLSCAAGYVDLVVGEKLHTNLLLQTKDAVTPGAHLVRRLPDAVAWLDGHRQGDAEARSRRGVRG